MTEHTSGIVVVGAGLAGAEAAVALRDCGETRRIVVLGQEPWMPYDRPPLSKAYLKGTQPRSRLWLRPDATYSEDEIDIYLDVSVSAIERSERIVFLEGGKSFRYEQLVLATGGEVRHLSIPGADLDGVMVLKTLDDADRMAMRLEKRPTVVVIGAGYVGMEFASTARLAGCDVTLIEEKSRVLSRSISPVISAYLQQEYYRLGVRILTQARITRIDGAEHVQSVALDDGRSLPADIVLVSVGSQADDRLARNAGLEIAGGGGVLVDRDGRTSDPSVFAAGDCATRPYEGLQSPQRLESVQSAIAQARRVARVITGQAAGKEEIPWFWSDQFNIRLQIAGLPFPGDTELIRGDPQSGRFSVIFQNENALTAIQCVNSAGDFAAAKKMIAQRGCYEKDQLCDQQIAMRNVARVAQTLSHQPL